MKVISNGGFNAQSQTMKCECTGHGWDNYPHIPCHAILELSGNDIVGMMYSDGIYRTSLYYGFTCPICKCFSAIDAKMLPPSIRSNAQRVAPPHSLAYENTLTQEQKEFSKQYFAK